MREAMKLYSETDIIRLRDEQSMEDSKRQTRETKERDGLVTFRGLFITMGFRHCYNDKWEKI